VPEGDTVFLAATRLRAALAGQTLTRTDFRVPLFATVSLAGSPVDDVTSHGKTRFSHRGRRHLHTHYMAGSWHLYPRTLART
jgi:endonuclease-8